jgi:hypothetical protein
VIVREQPVIAREQPVIGRRALLAGLAALPAMPALAGGVRALPASDRFAGPRPAALPAALSWTGTARVTAGGQNVVIGVRTRVVPFVRARSETWLVHRRETARTLIVEPDGAWTARGGLWTRMPDVFATHERAQYAIYGLMLGKPPAVRTPRGDGTVLATAPGAPDTVFGLGEDGLPAWAENRVPGETGGEVAQRFTFAGRLESGGVRWPSSIEITREGAPYFLMALTGFRAEG